MFYLFFKVSINWKKKTFNLFSTVDIWNGDNNEPVVYHGHTFTSKILFKDVIQEIDKAFDSNG